MSNLNLNFPDIRRQYEAAIATLRTAHEQWVSLNESVRLSESMERLAGIFVKRGEVDEAVAQYQEAIDLAAANQLESVTRYQILCCIFADLC